MNWMIALLIFGIGIAAGMLLTYRVTDGARRVRDLEGQLAEVREQYAAYRKEVGDHFASTATAVNRLTESYRDVHQQLRAGARRLCDDATAERALAFDRTKLIDAGPAGQRTRQAADHANEAAADDRPAPAAGEAGDQAEPPGADEAPPAPRDYADDGEGTSEESVRARA